MKGSRSQDNDYVWISQPSSKFKIMKDIISEDVVKEFPKLVIGEGKIRGVCQMGKMSN